MDTAEISNQSCLIFLHIPKTGGRTLEWMVLNREYRSNQAFRVDNRRLPDERERLKRTDPGQIDLLTGHIGYGWHEALQRPCQYITFLREPVDRVISLYFHLQRDPNHPLHETVRTMEIVDFLDSGVFSEETENGQARLLSGNLYGWPGVSPLLKGDELLTTALQNLQEGFLVVGLTERFDESLLLMKRSLGWSNHYYSRQNVGSNRPARDRIPDEALSRIAELNAVDLRLYSQAQALLEQKIAEQGKVFTDDLLRFRRFNRVYGAVYPLLRPFQRLRV